MHEVVFTIIKILKDPILIPLNDKCETALSFFIFLAKLCSVYCPHLVK